MLYAMCAAIAFALGSLGTFVAFDGWRRKLLAERRRLDIQGSKVKADLNELRVEREEAEGRIRAQETEATRRVAKAQGEAEARVRALDEEFSRTVANTRAELARRAAGLEAERAAFEARVVSYGELQGENTILKRDLQNVDVHLRKLQLD